MGVFKLYKFNNVTSPADFLNNLKNAASAEGWRVDGQSGSGPWFLYLSSNGNGSQQLYYSFHLRHLGNTSYLQNASNLYTLFAVGNTGYNPSASWDNQPGRWTNLPTSNYNYLNGYFISFPVEAQYIFVNSSQIVMFTETTHSFRFMAYDSGNVWFSTFENVKTNMGLFIGSIDLYKNNYNQGNALFLDGTHYLSTQSFNYSRNTKSNLFGHINTTLNLDGYGLILFEGQRKRAEVGLSVVLGYYVRNITDPLPFTASYSDINNKSTYQYRLGGSFLTFSNKLVAMKPVVFVRHAIGNYNYFTPIGELPYWYAPCSPYFKSGDIVQYGQRKFVIMSFFLANSPHGVLLEVVDDT